MSIPPIPPPLAGLGASRFSFYPPIVNVEHNEWIYRKATWSDLLVANARTGMEVWIPRRLVGEVSQIDDPVVIVGLNKELEFRAGAVWPHQRRVIEMPIAVGAPHGAPVRRPQPAPVIGIKTEPSTDSKVGRFVAAALVLGLVGSVLGTLAIRQQHFRPRSAAGFGERGFLELNREDDYNSVIRKLGAPAQDHWRSEPGAVHYRALRYAARNFTVILAGPTQSDAHYIGAIDSHGRPLDAIQYKDGNSAALLRRLGDF